MRTESREGKKTIPYHITHVPRILLNPIYLWASQWHVRVHNSSFSHQLWLDSLVLAGKGGWHGAESFTMSFTCSRINPLCPQHQLQTCWPVIKIYLPQNSLLRHLHKNLFVSWNLTKVIYRYYIPKTQWFCFTQ